MINQLFAKAVAASQQFIDTPYFKVAYLIFSFFIILMMIGLVRKRYFHLTMKGANFGFVAGVITVLLVETVALLIMLYGYKTIDIIKGKQSPQEIIQLTQEGVHRVNRVLGVQLCPQATPSATSILEQIPKLSKVEEDKVRQTLCR